MVRCPAGIAQVVSIPAAREEAMKQVKRRGQLQRSPYPWPGEMLSWPEVRRAGIEGGRDDCLYPEVRLAPVMVRQRLAQNKKISRPGRPVLKQQQSLAREGSAGDSPWREPSLSLAQHVVKCLDLSHAEMEEASWNAE